MEKENNCSNCKHTNKAEDEFPCSVCVRNYIDKYEPTTNYDRIKSMSVEEMVDLLRTQVGCGSDFIPCGIVCDGNCTVIKTEDCKEKIKQWLLQEVSDE